MERTFDSFVPASYNEDALDAALAAAAGTVQSVYLHGDIGKSHLLSAIEQFLIEAKVSVRSFTGREFRETVTSAFKAKEFSKIIEWRNLDAVLIDDIDDLQTHRRGQEELYHLLRGLSDRGGQAILSGRSEPDQLPLDPKLAQLIKNPVRIYRPLPWER